MSRFVQVDRDTAYLLPPSVQEWLPKDHLARYVVDESVMKFRQFLLRGVNLVSGEWDWVCLADNVKRMHRMPGT